MNNDVLIAGGVEPQSSRSRKMVLIIAILLLAVVLSAGVAYGYYEFDLFKSAKQVYLETEARALGDLSKSLGDNYTEYYNSDIKPYAEGATRMKGEITGDLGLVTKYPKGPSNPVPNFLKGIKLVLEQSVDPKKEQQYLKLDALMNNANLLGLEAFADKDKIAFGVPVLYNKYGVVNLKDSDKFKQRFGVQLPKKMINNNDVWNALKISQAELEPILKDYAKIYADNLTKDQVVIGKGTFTEADTKIDAKVITVSYNQEQYKQLAQKLAEKISGDDKLADLIVTKYNNYVKLYEDAGYQTSGLKPLDKAKVKSELVKLGDDLKNEKLTEDMKMILYVDKKHNILERKISVGKEYLRILNFTGADKNKTVTVDLMPSTGHFLFTYKAKPENDKTTKGTIYAESIEGGQSLQFNSSYSKTKDGNKQGLDLKYSVKVNGSTKADFSGDLLLSVTDNDKEKTRQSDAAISLKLDTAQLQGTVKLNAKGTMEFGKATDLPSLNNANSIDLANMSQEELGRVAQEIQLNAQKLFASNRLFTQFLDM